MTVASGRPVAGESRDQWVPWLLVAFIGVVVLVNGIMIWFAVTSFTGLQTEGHYVKGLEYNRVLESERAERALGWTVTVSYEASGEKRGRIVVRARDTAGEALDGAAVTARLVRPTQAGHDLSLNLAPDGDGVYTGEVELPLSGLWDIQTQIAYRSDVYRTTQRTVAP